MNAPPTVYAEWVVLLERFGNGDEEVVPAMQSGTIEWTNIVAERWTQQVVSSFRKRIDALSSTLQNGFGRSGTIDDIAQTMLLARRGIAPLRAFASIEAIPVDVKNHLVAELDAWIKGTQKHLEEQAEAAWHQDYGRLLKAFRDHPLGAGMKPEAATPSTPSVPVGNSSSRRRTILT